MFKPNNKYSFRFLGFQLVRWLGFHLSHCKLNTFRRGFEDGPRNVPPAAIDLWVGAIATRRTTAKNDSLLEGVIAIKIRAPQGFQEPSIRAPGASPGWGAMVN